MRISLICAMALTLGACSMTPTYERPVADVPAAWDAAAKSPAGNAVTAAWWQRFGSDELNSLMSEALNANHDLAAAAQRIEQARASAKVARSRLLPAVTATASASRDRTGSDGPAQTDSTDQVTMAASYEADLWGGNRASSAAARARVSESEYARDAVALTLQADVASDYFQILALRDRLGIAKQNLEAARQLLSLVEVRYDNGGATALDLAQQRTTTLGIQAEIPALEQSLNETLHALAVLLGRAPQGFDVTGQSLGSLSLPAIDADAPARLLDRRPDIRSAEAGLIAANADIGVARAALYPSIGLSAGASITGALTGGSTTVASLATSLAQTIFDGGSLRGQVSLSEAARAELAESYVQAVLTSFKEVEDSLSAVSTSASRAQLLAETAAQAREAHRLADVRYREGVEDLLTLLDSQRTQLSAEDNLVQARLSSYVATLSLFKSLGGGWSEAG